MVDSLDVPSACWEGSTACSEGLFKLSCHSPLETCAEVALHAFPEQDMHIDAHLCRLSSQVSSQHKHIRLHSHLSHSQLCIGCVCCVCVHTCSISQRQVLVIAGLTETCCSPLTEWQNECHQSGFYSRYKVTCWSSSESRCEMLCVLAFESMTERTVYWFEFLISLFRRFVFSVLFVFCLLAWNLKYLLTDFD